MRILFCAPYVPSRLRPRPFNFIRKLAERGHRITLLAVTTTADQDIDGLAAVCQRVQLFPLARAPAVARCATTVWRDNPLQVAYCNLPEFRQAVRNETEHGNYDLLHLEHLRASRAAIDVEALPKLYDSVDAMTELWRGRRHSGSLTTRLIAWFEVNRLLRYECQVLQRFDTCVVSSERDRIQLQRLAPTARFCTIPNGVDVDRFARFPRTPKAARVLFIGRMSYGPNVDAAKTFARQVLPRLALSEPDVEYRIVGAGPTPAVAQLASVPRVTVTGFVEDVAEELAAASVSVCNVPVAGGTQNKILESLAAGVPVVATRQTAAALGLVDMEQVLVADTPDEIAASVSRLLRQDGVARRIGEAGRAHVRRNFSLERTASMLINEYERCLDEYRHAAPARAVGRQRGAHG